MLSGSPYSEWGVPDFRDNRIAGFATKMSLNSGETVRFKINVQSGETFTMKIYRIGYYGGNGASLKHDFGTLTGTVQPTGTSDPATGLLDCSNWSESASWAIPSTAVSGFYIAKMERTGGGSNHIAFIVRNDASNSDLYLQMPDATWQAYNGYGGNSLYDGTTGFPGGHAVKVSYNRPLFPYNSAFNTDGRGSNWYMNAEYPMIRWLERNGYDVTYTSSNDVANNGSRLLNHKVYISMAHDEYWSKEQRNNVEAARNAGVHLAFFSGNEVYWKTRWESFDGTEDRTLVCYKEGTLGDGTTGERTCGTKCDASSSEWTGLWRTGGNFDAGKPENELTGQVSWTEFMGEIGVPAFYKNLRFWRNTAVTDLSPGQTAFLGVQTLGYEWDWEQPQYAASYPAGRITMSSRTISNLTHKLSLYRHSSGALIFGAGTVQWSWGLDGNHLGGTSTISPEMQQATVNLLADMGVQPGTLQSGLVAAAASTDFTAPGSSITSPSSGASFSSGATVTITGTASDGGGGVVGGVEVSFDGGVTWKVATITDPDINVNWTYSWTTGANGTYNITSRGIDDSGNKGNGGSGINVTVGTDVSAPQITSVAPVNGATGVNTAGTVVTANFNEAINGASATGSTFQLRDAGNNLVSAGINTSGNQVTLTPAATLNSNTVYTATLTGGASGIKDLAGNALAGNFSWSFTTGGATAACPCTVFQPGNSPLSPFNNDGQGIAVGMRFRSLQNGFITGVRYYKGAGTTGSHSGSLWTNTGTLLAQATFTNETASGWQEVSFGNPVAITANVTYVVSQFSPSGHYSSTVNYFSQATVNGPLRGLADGEDGQNGVYMYSAIPVFPNNSFQATNYWVDVVFSASAGTDITPPTVTSVSPINGATNVITGTSVIANFSEAINPSTVTSSTFQLRDAGNNLVSGTLTASGNQVTLVPVTPLANATVYTVTIVSGAAGVKDPAGNALAQDYSWSFTTAAGGGTTTMNIFQPSDVPSSPLNNDGQGISLGVRFQSSQDGFINGIRYYKGAGTTGTHTGSLWTNNGSLLAQVTFSSETASGWQQALFNTPVAITAGVTYVASYHSPSGHFPSSVNYFTQAVQNGPLRALANGENGFNGLYRYSASPVFPSNGYQASNYWADVVFTANAGPDNTPPTVTSVVPQNGATGVVINATVTANFSEAISASTVNSTTFRLRDAGGSIVSATLNAGSTQVVLTPAAPLSPSTTYTLTITGGASGVKDLAGNALANDFTSSFTTASVDNTPPTVTAVSPPNGSNGAGLNSTVNANFSEPINTSTVTGTTFQLRNAGGSLVSATVAGNGDQAVLTPLSPLSPSATYTATLTGGASGIKDLAGNALASNFSWTFTTSESGSACPCTVFQPSNTPQAPHNNDGSGISVGMKFRSTQNGFITGVRYYKGTGTTGSHIGSLWSSTGTLLAQATFINETASGWQQVLFSNPVAITAGVTYVVTKFSPSGDYASTVNYFTQATVNGPLRGLANGEDGANGLYQYSSTAILPVNSFNASNYWVDVVFNTGSGGGLPSVTSHPASKTACESESVSFSSTATGSPVPTVQWQENINGTWSAISGATSSTLTVAASASLNNRQYRAVWTNSTGSVNSNAATLTVNNLPSAPTVTVVNNCGNSVLTASNYTGSLLWSTGATTPSITVTAAGNFTVTQTVTGCTSAPGNGTAAPVVSNVQAPGVEVTNNCGSSVLTATGVTGSLLWSTGATTASITVSTAGVYTVTQTENGCTSPPGSGTAAPKPVPVLSGSLTATVTTGTVFSYTASSSTAGTSFSWSRAAVTGITNAAATGSGNISETLINSTLAPVNVTYVYTLTANGCTNTQNLVVTVTPLQSIVCNMGGSLQSSFNSTSIPAGRYIWFNSVLDRGSFTGITGTVTFYITNSQITFTANSQQYVLNVPNARIRFDAAVTSASTQFTNNTWETVVPRSYSNFVFMTGLTYQVPANLPGNISNVRWTANIGSDKTGLGISWKWAAAVYTSFAGHPGLNIKPIGGSTQNPYPNSDRAGSPENFKSFVIAGAKGNGGSNYTGNYSGNGNLTCTVAQKMIVQTTSTERATLENSLNRRLPGITPEDLITNFDVQVLPNPSKDVVNLIVSGNGKEPVTIKVWDVFGKVLEIHERIASEKITRLGQNWRSGTYIAEVKQGDKRKIVKIIKVN